MIENIISFIWKSSPIYIYTLIYTINHALKTYLDEIIVHITAKVLYLLYLSDLANMLAADQLAGSKFYVSDTLRVFLQKSVLIKVILPLCNINLNIYFRR